MKTLFSSSVLGFALSAAVSSAAYAQGGGTAQGQEKAMQDCFEKHAGLMAKPAVKNSRDCWWTHRHLMQNP